MPLVLAVFATAVLASPALAWGSAGHRIVAEIAEGLLSPATRTALASLLEPGQRLTDVADWADEYRRRCRATSPWHYVNIPIRAAGYDAVRDCPEPRGCVIRAIDAAREVLADPARPHAERSRALRLLVHFIGDLHQPLHSGDRGDRGGNDLQVRFAGRTTNLHRVWDHDLIEWTGRSARDYARMLARSLTPAEQRRFRRGTPIGWALEAHRAARRAYGRLPGPPRAGELVELGDAYASAMLPSLDEQLLRAGVRLAHTLDDALSRAQPAGDSAVRMLGRCSRPE